MHGDPLDHDHDVPLSQTSLESHEASGQEHPSPSPVPGVADACHPHLNTVEQSLGLFESPHYDPSHPGTVIGDPADEIMNWHYQQSPDTCAIVSQEFVLDSFGLRVSEPALTQLAEVDGFYTPGGGTPMLQVGSLLSAFGLPVTQEQHATFSELEDRLAHGDKIIVGIDGHKVWHDVDVFHDDGAPNHAVEVIGVDVTDPTNPMVILNDSGAEDGKGLMVPLDDFQQAWAASSNFLVAVSNTANVAQQPVAGWFPALTFGTPTSPDDILIDYDKPGFDRGTPASA